MGTMTVSMRGVQGLLQWGYHVAAQVPTWQLIGNADGGTVSGPVTAIDTYRVSQRPLVFAVPRPQGTWRWPIVTLQITGDTFTATVGPSME